VRFDEERSEFLKNHPNIFAIRFATLQLQDILSVPRTESNSTMGSLSSTEGSKTEEAEGVGGHY